MKTFRCAIVLLALCMLFVAGLADAGELKATTPMLNSLNVPGYYSTGKPNAPWVSSKVVKRTFRRLPVKCSFVVKTLPTDGAVRLHPQQLEPAFQDWLLDEGFTDRRRIYWQIWEEQ